MSAVTLESVCGMSGLGDGSTVQQVRLLQPGTNTGVVPRVRPADQAARTATTTDWNNVAPSIGVAWQPNVQGGFLRTILGDPEQATLRGGYSESFERQGLAAFTGIYGAQPGQHAAH